MEKYSSEDKYSIFPKLAGFFLLVLLIVSASLWAFRESKVTAELQRSTYVLIMRADALLSELKDAETGQRGFLLLGDERYLEPYLLVADKIGGHLEELNQNHDNTLPVPAVFVVDCNGSILYKFADADYRNRLDIDELLQSL